MNKELDESLAEDIIKLEKELEVYKRAFKLVLNQLSKYEYSDINWLEQARKELENDKNGKI